MVALARAGRTIKTAYEQMEDARENMLYSLPFFGTLALELDLVEDKGKGSSTDGKRIRFNGDHIGGMSFEDRQYLIGHEVLHCALQHHVRCGNRHLGKWNFCCDLVVDKILIDSGFALPSSMQENYRAIMQHGDKTAEEIYALLDDDDYPEDYGNEDGQGDQPSDAEEPGNGGKSDDQPMGEGSGNRSDDAFGRVDAPSDAVEPSELAKEQQEWESKVSKAQAVAKRMGKGSVGADRTVEALKKNAEVPWKELLRDFVERYAKGDYTWSMPNRRYMTTLGLYLPALHSREAGKIVIAVDTSGSIDEKALQSFETEVNAIFSEFPHHVVVMYCDTKICKVDEFQEGEIVSFKPKGGGGTSFKPVFDEVNKKHTDAECIIYFTDGWGSYPKEKDVKKPVFWMLTDEHDKGSRYYPPYGKVVQLKLLDDDNE